MRRIFNRRGCKLYLNLSGALCAAALAAFLAAFVSPARAGEEQLAKAGAANHPLLIREHAAWNMDCQAVPYPAVRLEQPPRYGTVCARAADITIRTMYAGTEAQCIGRTVQGLRLIYVPRPGFTGSDRLQYSVQYPSARRSVSVTVNVGAGRGMMLPTGTVGAGPEAGQAPGPVPPCEAPVS